MSDARRTDSVRHLQLLYSTVVGVGLALAMTRTVDATRSAVVIDWRSVPVLIAYVATLVPFYHGALRHLDDAYIHGVAAQHGRSGVLLADFIVLFVESSVLFALAAFMPSPVSFVSALLCLLAIDSAWGVLFYRVTSGPSTGRSAELAWARVNAVTIAGIGGLLVIYHLTDISPSRHRLALGLVVLAISLARTIVDYRSSWPFYFPD